MSPDSALVTDACGQRCRAFSTAQAQMKNIERLNVPGIRKALGALGAVVAEVDRELRRERW